MCVEQKWQSYPFCCKATDREIPTEFEGRLEIISLARTVSIHGSHLHISVSAGKGKTMGGHLASGRKFYTTAEIVLAKFIDVIYKREFAGDSGYDELVVYDK